MILWGDIEIADGETRSWLAGAMQCHVRKIRDEWQIAFSGPGVEQRDGAGNPEIDRIDETDPPPLDASTLTTPPPEDAAWVRYVSTGSDQLSLVPALPDLPVVVRPDAPIVLLPGRRGKFYFSIPVWLRLVSRSNGRDQTMHEEPIIGLSHIWFGDPSAGELCYSLDDPLVRDFSCLTEQSAAAICPLQVRNSSSEPLKFERICVHVEYLNLYQRDQSLWTNEVSVQFKGSDQVSQISISPRGPEGTTLLTRQRQPANRNLLKKSFNLLRQVTGI